MAKVTGLAMTTLSIDDSAGVVRDLRNDFTSFEFATPRDVQDVTGLDKSARERLLLLADFSITVNGVFDPGTNLMHDVMKTVSSTSVGRTTTLTMSAKSLAPEVLYTDYNVKRSESGELTCKCPGVLFDGVVPLWT